MIRLMTVSDVVRVQAVEEACFSVSWSDVLLEEGLRNPLDTYLVAEEDGIIQGYCCFRVISGEGEIQRIAVLPEYRGQGLGKKLMDAMVAFARKHKVLEMTLEVRSGNGAAINLYKRYGFKEEAVRCDYYSDPREDALIMWNRSV